MEHLIVGFVDGKKFSGRCHLGKQSFQAIEVCERSLQLQFFDLELFYDWYASVSGDIEGLVLRLDSSAPAASVIKSNCPESFDYGPFPRIALKEIFVGAELGLEAFGDIRIMANDHGDSVFLVPINGWLNNEQAESVRHAVPTADVRLLV